MTLAVLLALFKTSSISIPGLAQGVGLLVATLGLLSYAIKALIGLANDRFGDMREDRDYWKKRAIDSEEEARKALRSTEDMRQSINNVADAVESVSRRLREAEK